MFKLLIFGLISLSLGVTSGFAGSYIYDKKINGEVILTQDVSDELLVLGESSAKQSKNDEMLSFNEVEGTSVDLQSQIVEKEVETKLPTATHAISPTPSITPIPKASEETTPTIVPTKSATSEEINGFIERFSQQYGVDPNIMRHIAVCESGFNPSAINRNYAGLYQFSPNTWQSNRTLMGENVDINLRFNAEEAVQTAAYMLSIGKRHVWPSC